MRQSASLDVAPEQSSSHQPVTDLVIASWPDLCQVVPDRFQSAENHAIAEWRERQPHVLDSYRGYESFSEALHRVGREFCDRGFVQERVDGQVRYLHHSSGIRFLIARATLVKQDRFRLTSTKGEVSRSVVEQNRQKLGYSLALYTPQELQRIKGTATNLWWIADVHGTQSVSTYLVYPNDLSKDGLFLCCEECRHIGDRDLSEGDVASMELPPAPPPEKAPDLEVHAKQQSQGDA